MPETVVVELVLSREDVLKLDRLAKMRGCTWTECIHRLIRNLQPGGSGWQHPAAKRAELA